MFHIMKDTSTLQDVGDDRPVKPALWSGWQRKCPSCGTGPMMDGYLQVRKSCAVCGTELHHHRADDGPAWATMLIAGHLMAPLMLIIYETWRPEGWVMGVGLSVIFVLLALYLLPRIKGMFVAFQWAKRMHGFGHPQR